MNNKLEEFLGGKDVMPIGGYYGPHPKFESDRGADFPDLYSDEIFEAIAESGVKLIVYSHTDYKYTPELVKRMLDLGEKYGVGIFVLDSNVTEQQEEDKIKKEVFQQYISQYCNHPAFCGMYVVDEPRTPYFMPGDGTKYISRYEKIAKVLQYDMGLACYLNMFPVWNLALNQENYERYVAEFCETLKPKVIMWDNYPFAASDGLEVYFYNMNLMRNYAKKQNVPFWGFIEAGAQWNDEKKDFDSKLPYYPNEAQFQWNINTCLAFGAKGIQYFPLIQPDHFAYAKSTQWDEKRNGLIGVFGNKNQWHGYAKNISVHIRAIDDVLMNSVNEGVIVTGKQAKEDMKLTNCMIDAEAFCELVSVIGDVMIGCFKYGEKTALYVVNYSMDSEQQIELRLDDVHELRVVQCAKEKQLNSQAVKLDMVAGEGVLVVIDERRL